MYYLPYLFSFLFLLFASCKADCASKDSCGSCTGDTTCVWCNSEGSCIDGSFWGVKGSGCGGWRWKQCKVNGVIPFAIVLGLIILVLLALFFIICRCCWFQSKRRAIEADYTLFDDKAKTPKSNKRREEMAKKYGIGEPYNAST